MLHLKLWTFSMFSSFFFILSDNSRFRGNIFKSEIFEKKEPNRSVEAQANLLEMCYRVCMCVSGLRSAFCNTQIFIYVWNPVVLKFLYPEI